MGRSVSPGVGRFGSCRRTGSWSRSRRLLVGLWYVPAAWLPFAGVGGVQWAAWSGHPSTLINASLWTLWPEILCYAVLAVMPVRSLRVGVPVVGASLVLMAGTAPEQMLGAGVVFGPSIAFVVGAFMALWPGRIPLAAPIVAAGAGAAFVTVGTMAGLLMVAATCAYASIWAGARVPLRWKFDLSYGTYIFAFPVAQVLFALGAAGAGVLAFAGIATAIVLPIAAVSWFLIERPALRAGAKVDLRRFGRRPRAARAARSERTTQPPSIGVFPPLLPASPPPGVVDGRAAAGGLTGGPGA